MSKPTRANAFYQERMEVTNWDPEDLYDPPTPDHTAMNVLIRELLGMGWYIAEPESNEQVNTVAVYQIIRRYVDEAYISTTRLKRRMFDIIKFLLGVVTGLILYQLMYG